MKILLFLLLFPLTILAAEQKIFSMNLHCALGDWEKRVDSVVREIVQQRPDVIGLQEVCYNETVDMALYIREALESSGYEIKAHETFETHRSFLKYQEQLLLISRLPVEEVRKGPLPSVPMLLNGYVAFRIGRNWYLTTHLHFAIPQIRRRQYEFIRKNFGGLPTIIFGDLNSNSENGETNVLASADWIPFFDGPTYPSRNPEKTFDGFWMTKEFHEKVMTTTMERLFVGVQEAPSDHLGVQLTIYSR